MEAAVALLARAPERSVGSQIGAQPAEGPAEEGPQVWGPEDFEAQPHIAEPAPDGEATEAGRQVGSRPAVGQHRGRERRAVVRGGRSPRGGGKRRWGRRELLP